MQNTLILRNVLPSSKAESLNDSIASPPTIPMMPPRHEAITPHGAAGTRAIADLPFEEMITAAMAIVIIVTTAKAAVTTVVIIARAIVETVATVTATVLRSTVVKSTGRIAATTIVAASPTMREKLTPSRKPILITTREELK